MCLCVFFFGTITLLLLYLSGCLNKSNKISKEYPECAKKKNTSELIHTNYIAVELVKLNCANFFSVWCGVFGVWKFANILTIRWWTVSVGIIRCIENIEETVVVLVVATGGANDDKKKSKHMNPDIFVWKNVQWPYGIRVFGTQHHTKHHLMLNGAENMCNK